MDAPSSPLGAWQQRALHTITCPSGQRLKIRVPGLASLLAITDLPERLAALVAADLTEPGGALGQIARDARSDDPEQRASVVDRLRDFAALQRQLVALAVVAVETGDDVWEQTTLTADAALELPDEDVEMVAEIVQRLRFDDARGVTVGVEPLDRWAAFRDTHGCAEHEQGGADCAGCTALLKRFSSADVG